MTLQVSGAISLSNIQSEFGGSNLSLGSYRGLYSSLPYQGPIAVSDFYGVTYSASSFQVTVENCRNPVYTGTSYGYMSSEAASLSSVNVQGGQVYSVNFSIIKGFIKTLSDVSTQHNFYIYLDGDLTTTFTPTYTFKIFEGTNDLIVLAAIPSNGVYDSIANITYFYFSGVALSSNAKTLLEGVGNSYVVNIYI